MRRFSILGLMAIVAVAGVLLASARSSPALAMRVACAIASGGMAWRAGREWPHLSGRGFLLATGVFVPAIVAANAYSLALHRLRPLAPALFALYGSAAGLGVAWAAGRPRRKRVALVIAFLGAFPAATISTRWPLRLAFYLSSPSLNRLADRVESGGPLMFPAWAGAYRIESTRPHLRDTALIVAPDPSDMTGFVRRKHTGNSREPLDLGGGWRWYCLK